MRGGASGESGGSSLRPMDRIFSWPDTESWKPLLRSFSDRRLSRKRVVETLIAEYDGIEVFHACRPEKLLVYYQRGLMLSDSDGVDNLALKVFFGDEPSALDVQSLNSAISQIGVRDQGKLYVSIDLRSLVNRSGHYLIYGSERLLCLAAALCGDTAHYREKLKKIGTPTIFRAVLHWGSLDDSDIDELARHVVAELIAIKKQFNPRVLMCSFILDHAVPPSDLIGHLHPIEIPDPMDGYSLYRMDTLSVEE